MDIISEKKLENSVIELEIEIPVEKVELEYKTVFNKLQKNAKIDGFRQGKAPLQLIETKYREYAGEEVAENLAKSTFYDAVMKQELQPIVEPKIEFISISRELPFKYKATFEVMPTVEIGQYTGIKSEEKVCNVSDSDVSEEIETIIEKFADIKKSENPDTAIVNGHLARFQLKRIDDVSSDEADRIGFKDYSIIVGKSVDDFTLDKHLLGMKAGEEKTVSIKYPDTYYMKELAGQDITYLVRITEINDVILPELNDELAAKAGYESVEDMKVKVRDYLEKFIKDRISSEVRNDLINKIVETTRFDIPDSMIINEMYTIFQKIQQRIGYKTDSIENFAAIIGMDPAEYRIKLREDAVKSVKNTLVLSEISKKEDLKVENDKYMEVLNNIAAQSGKTLQEVEEIIEKNQSRSSIEHDLLLEYAMDFIHNKADITRLPAVKFQDFVKNRMA